MLKTSSQLNRKHLDHLNDSNYGFQIGNLGTIREENSLSEKMLEKNVNSFQPPKEISSKIQLVNHYSKAKQNKQFGFNDIPNDIIIKHVLFYLDINSLPKFSTASKKTSECVKIHIFIRLHFLNKEKKLIEQENYNILSSIDERRRNFFEEYEITMPDKEHAIKLMQSLSNKDILEIKQCFRKYNKNYEEIIAPLVLILGSKVSF